jgi:Zn-finger nucleic acid-binding protein
MPYMNCPSCGLTLAVRESNAEIRHCPRCIARRRKLVGMIPSEQPLDRRHEREPTDTEEREQ